MSLGFSIQRLLSRSGYTIVKTRGRYFRDGLLTAHNADFRNEPDFVKAYGRGIKASGGLDPGIEWRVHTALWAGAHCLSVEGDFVECGVNAGFTSSALMQYCHWSNTGKRFILIDTFSGPVFSQYSDSERMHGRVNVAERAISRGAYVTDLDRVRSNFSEWSNVSIVQGAIPDVLQQISFGRIAFAHIDMNCALPEKAAFEFLYPRLTPGGIILFDDYTYHGHDAQHSAINSSLSALDARILSMPTGQGLVTKSQ